MAIGEDSALMKPNMIQTRRMDFMSKNITSHKKEPTIHSGHFMTSRVHEKTDDVIEEKDLIKGYDFLDANKETADTSSVSSGSKNAIAIDASLTKVFQCMTLAYR